MEQLNYIKRLFSILVGCLALIGVSVFAVQAAPAPTVLNSHSLRDTKSDDDPAMWVKWWQYFQYVNVDGEATESFGTININSQGSASTYLICLGEGVSITDVKLDNENGGIFSASIGEEAEDYNGETVYPLIIAYTSGNTEGVVEGFVRVYNDTGDEVKINATATVSNLNASTLMEFKEKATSLRTSEIVNFNGRARVNMVYNKTLAVSDETASIILTTSAIPDDIKPGCFIDFTGSRIGSGIDADSWNARTLRLAPHQYPGWEMPERQTVTQALTEKDFGKYVILQNVTFDHENIYTPIIPNEDGTKPTYIYFTDDDENEYRIYPPGATNPYGFGIPEEYKQEGVKLDIIGCVIGTNEAYGPALPHIVPEYIRPIEPENPIEPGSWKITAKSYLSEATMTWSLEISEAPGNPYGYIFSPLVKDLETSDPVFGELNPACDEIIILTGQELRDGVSTNSTEYYLATAESFDLTGNTPEQEPSPKGTPLVFKKIDNEWQLDQILDYCIYTPEFKDPENPSWDSRWSHNGLWYAGAVMAVNDTPDDPAMWVKWWQYFQYVNVDGEATESFGNVNINSQGNASTYLICLGEGASITDVKIDNENGGIFSASIGEETEDYNGETVYPLIIAYASGNTEGAVEGFVRVYNDTGDEVKINTTATIRDLNASTLMEFKEKAISIRSSETVYFNGRARVNMVFDKTLAVSDETASLILNTSNIPDDILPGSFVVFSGATNGMVTIDADSWNARTLRLAPHQYPGWEMPERLTVAQALTEEDFGKYIVLKNVTFNHENIYDTWPREDGTKPTYIYFTDEGGNEYRIYPPGATNPYGFGIPEEYKQEGVKLDILGCVIGANEAYGNLIPHIVPEYIRPIEPENPIEPGSWRITAKSYITEAPMTWNLDISEAPGNPYGYIFSPLVKDLETGDPVFGELNPACDEIIILTGQELRDGVSTHLTDYYLATAESFDRTGNTPEQEPSPKGTPLVFKKIGNKWQLDQILDFCQYTPAFKDPENPFWSWRWNHCGLWYAGAVMVANKPYPKPTGFTAVVVNERDVQLDWDAVPESEWEHKGYRIFCNGEEFAQVGPSQTSYLVGNNRDGRYGFKICALYLDEGEIEESVCTDDIFVTIETTGIDNLNANIISVRTENGAILIRSTNVAEATIFNLSGCEVARTTVNGECRISLAAGIYIVKVSDKVFKVICK